MMSNTMRIKNLTCLLLSGLVTGCMFHDNTPLAQAPDSFSVSNAGQPVINLPAHPWWEEMGSMELNGLVMEALENNKKITTAIKHIEIAQSELDTVRLGWLPTFSFLAGRVHANATVLLPNLPVPVSTASNFSAFLPMWIANIVQLPNKTKEAEKNMQSTAAEYLAIRTSVASQVVSAYAVLLASIEEDRILASLKSNLNERLATVSSMNKQGLNTGISVNDLDSAMQKLQAQIASNRSNSIAAKNALLVLIGRPVQKFTPRESFSMLKLAHAAPGNTPTSVLETRPDVVAARAKIEAADYGISSTASLFAPIPTFTSANVRVSSNDNGTNSTTIASMQAGMAVWVLDPQLLGKINTKNKQFDASIIHYLSVVDQAMREVDDALASFEANKTRLINEERSLSNASKNLATYKAMYQRGLLSNTQFLEGTAQFDLAEMAIVQTKVQTVIAFSKLYQSMGGGATFGENRYQLQDQSISGIDRADKQN